MKCVFVSRPVQTCPFSLGVCLGFFLGPSPSQRPTSPGRPLRPLAVQPCNTHAQQQHAYAKNTFHTQTHTHTLKHTCSRWIGGCDRSGLRWFSASWWRSGWGKTFLDGGGKARERGTAGREEEGGGGPDGPQGNLQNTIYRLCFPLVLILNLLCSLNSKSDKTQRGRNKGWGSDPTADCISTLF